MKNRAVERLRNDRITILWFTSDINDLLYSELKWEMTEDSIHRLESFPKSVVDETSLKSGEISLQTTQLNFAYDTNIIFTNLNISIDNFRCLGIVGENGCGKSTLASLLLNIEEPSSGKINLTNDREKQINTGFLDQFPERLVGISTIEELITKLISNNILEEPKIPAIIKDLNELKIDWDSIRSVSGNRLSWTLLRIVLICILANCNYEILILDEPTFGMGLKQKNNLRSYLIRYLDKKHLILISHDKLFVESICDEIVEL
jgi:ATPase subunit of ABC transporter with duplicated ATPase domains